MIMLNESQTSELIEALEHAEELVYKQKKDASVISVGSNSWVALPTESDEYYDETLVRVCYTNPAFLGHENSITGERFNYKDKDS